MIYLFLPVAFPLTPIAGYPVPARLALFLLTLLSFWVPIALPIYLFGNLDPNSVSIAVMGLLFLDFLILLQFWNRKIYKNPHFLKPYGLAITQKNWIDLLNGLAIGLSFTLALFVSEAILSWIEFEPLSVSLLPLIAEGLLVAVGIALAEELFFRGWLLEELQRDYSLPVALWASAIIFASLHFLKPISEVIRTLPQFPALVLLGLTLVWARRSCSGRLGICIGIHGGLVWGYYILKVGQLYRYTDRVSPLITGIDGNPIAGGMGLIFLAVLAIWMRRQARLKNQ